MIAAGFFMGGFFLAAFTFASFESVVLRCSGSSCNTDCLGVVLCVRAAYCRGGLRRESARLSSNLRVQ